MMWVFRCLSGWAVLCVILTPAPSFSQPQDPSITPPSILGKPEHCPYPAEAVRTRWQGNVTVTAIIQTNGKLRDLGVAKSTGNNAIDEEAIKCVSTRQYVPAKKNGVPIEIPWSVSITWRIEGPPGRDITADRAAEITSLTKMLAESPNNTSMLFKRAGLFMSTEQYSDAIADYTKALSIRPDNIREQLLLANAYEYRKDPKAKESYDKAVALDPKSADARLARGRYLRANGNPVEARTDYDAIVQLDPNGRSPRFWRAGLLLQLKEYDAARTDVDFVLQTSRTDNLGYSALYLRAQTFNAEGNFALSIPIFDEIGSIRPSPISHNNSCWYRAVANQDLDKALAYCTESLRIESSNATTLDSRGLVYFRLNRFPEALATYDRALTFKPKEASSLYMRGIIKKRTGDNSGGDADIAAAKAADAGIGTRYAGYGIVP